MRVLLLEDDATVRSLLREALQANGFAVDETERAAEAVNLAGAYPYDALIVDVMLPENPDGGFDVVRELRQGGLDAPVLFLTGRQDLSDRVRGLDAGGDSYLVKPFHVSEVLAQLRALLRRQRSDQREEVALGGVRLNFRDRSVSLAGRPVPLTAKEYGLLELLASHPGRLFTRDEIIEHGWPSGLEPGTKIVDIYVKNIRQKLGDGVIQTVRGIGYRFPALEDGANR
ncbi:MAG TPA: response regulator transcription factor [Deinococcales bacterium]|nr:response regulator transcription factor [Deinococcales bacterium]